VVRVPDTPSSSGDSASCEISELGTCVQLTVRGELDLASVRVLRDAAARVDFAPGHVVLLDLCHATLVGSSAVHFALGLNARAVARGASLVVIGRPRTRELFALAGAEDITIVEEGEAPAA
jgi:anti-anti-sigma regulatory factor